MKKNCILVDFNVPDNWNFKLALEETMKTKWETLSCITNRLHGNKIKNCFRYIKYFLFSFKIFMNKNKYERIIAWQQFYGLLLVFYCRLFKVKKVPDIYIMTFIYKPKKNKLYNKMIKYIVTSKYIKKLVVLSKSEQDYYSKIFNIDRNLFCVINIGVCDISSKVKKQENEEKYYLAVGRSNRDYKFLRDAWKKEYGKLIIINDSYNEEDKDGIVNLKNCYGDAYLQMVANCYAEIIPLDDPNISSGSLSFCTAMMLSKPTIVTKNSTVYDYIKNGHNGFIINKTNKELENAIIALEEKNKYIEISENARKEYLEKFSENSLGRNIANMILLDTNITISLDEMKKIELNILKKIDKICREKNLRYSLMCGSLIGAIRHHGFIPWDDDIDIMMPRPDYEKLKEYFEKNEVEGIKYLSCEIQEDYYYPFAKIVDTNTILKEQKQYEIKDYGVFVDIFPIDGVEKISLKRKIQIKRFKFLRNVLQISFHSEVDTDSRFKFIIKYIFAKIVKIFGFRKIVKHINKLCKKINWNNAEYATILYSTISTKSEKYYKKEFFEEYIDVEFEGEKIKALKEYDTILRDEFGDYMQLPPEEKRKTVHNIEILKRKSN